MSKCTSTIASALLTFALSGCGVTGVTHPVSPAAATSMARPDARAEFAAAMNDALKGDMRAALPRFRTVAPEGLDPEKQNALAGILANFDAKVPTNDRCGLDAWTAKVLDAYRGYWSRVMTGAVSEEAGQRELAETLASLLGAGTGNGVARDMDALEPRLEEQIRARGYFSLHGVTAPFREFILWRRQVDQSYEVALPDGRQPVSVAMLEDFISLGWTGFATGGYYHTAGWATPERLFCVRMSYDLDSESFRISYLAHEGQHFSDYKRFPGLEGPELEYRAKLVEIAYADKTLGELLKAFSEQGADQRDNPHGYANRRLTRDLARTLNVAIPDYRGLESVAPATIRAAAARLFNEDSRRLERGVIR